MLTHVSDPGSVPPVLMDCKYAWCGRVGNHGFKREDHRKEHYRTVHRKEIEYSKTGRGGKKRSSKSDLREMKDAKTLSENEDSRDGQRN